MSGDPEPAGRAAELRRALIVLCITEITSWGVLYYAFPVMLTSVAETTGWSTQIALSAFSVGLLTSAAAAPLVGRLLQRFGPRPVMTAGSVIGVAALCALAAAPSLPWFFAAWIMVGLAQSGLLYPPAFAALTRWYGARRLRAITTLSLVAGLASTVYAPATSALLTVLDWRQTYLVLAVVLAVVTIPLHAFGLTPAWHHDEQHGRRRERPVLPRGTLTSRPFVLLVLSMALAAFGLFGATLNLVPLLTSRGVNGTLAATALGVVGIGQLLGRVGYPALSRHSGAHTRTAVILAAGALTVAVLGGLTGPIAAEIAVAVCAGAARGAYTLIQATAVSDRWGTENYATLNGIAIAPATAMVAVAPAGAALLADGLQSYPYAYYLLAALVLVGAALALGSRVARPVDHQEVSEGPAVDEAGPDPLRR